MKGGRRGGTSDAKESKCSSASATPRRSKKKDQQGWRRGVRGVRGVRGSSLLLHLLCLRRVAAERADFITGVVIKRRRVEKVWNAAGLRLGGGRDRSPPRRAPPPPPPGGVGGDEKWRRLRHDSTAAGRVAGATVADESGARRLSSPPA